MERIKVLILHPNHPDIEGIAKCICSVLMAHGVVADTRSDYWEVQPWCYDRVYILINKNSTEHAYKSTRWYDDRRTDGFQTNVSRLVTQTMSSYKKKWTNSHKMRFQYEKEEAERLIKQMTLKKWS